LALLLFITAFRGQELTKQRVVADGAKPILLSNEFSFTEGPAVDKDGNVYFTDQPNNRIIKWNEADGSFSVFMDSSRRSNGMFFDQNGNLISCADQNNQLISIDTHKNITVLMEGYKDKRLNGPNDLWIDKKGGIYVTDPYYQRPWWTHKTMPQNGQCVYYLNADRNRFIRVVDDFKAPNGIIGTPNGKRLYISDIDAGKTFVYKIRPDGLLSNKKLVFEEGSDGMTLDELENIYITNKEGVTVFNKKGQQIDQIPIDEPWTANVCFCGKNRDKLFITASGSVYIINMKVKGAY
jgi:gluconolactonase